jgi:hypothetical protein
MQTQISTILVATAQMEPVRDAVSSNIQRNATTIPTIVPKSSSNSVNFLKQAIEKES